MTRPSETGPCPSGQAPAGLDASRCDPARNELVVAARDWVALNFCDDTEITFDPYWREIMQRINEACEIITKLADLATQEQPQ